VTLIIQKSVGREGSQLRTIDEAVQVIDKAPKGNDPLEYIFGDLLETFSPDETKVLAALTHFAQPAKLRWIADMTELPERAAETALEDLTDRSILIANIESKTFYLPPLASQFIKTHRPEAVIQTSNILVKRALELAMQHGGFSNYDGFRALDAEWEFISASILPLLTGSNHQFQTFCDRLFDFLNYTGRWDAWVWLSEQAEVDALAADDKESAGWYAYQGGFAYRTRHQTTEVMTYAARVTQYWQNSTPRRKALAIQLRGIGHELNEDNPAAMTAYREALEIFRAIAPEKKDFINTADDCWY